jgi:hypothetical protein
MKTHPNTTAWLKLVVLDVDRDAIMVARATTGRSGDRVAIGQIAERAGCPVEVLAAPSTCAGWVHSETEVTS